MNNLMVSICCTAYNHEDYIAEAIDSFLMQKTGFRFEILIHDDASTDRTAEIIREYEKKYPDIIKPIYQTINQYSKGVNVPHYLREFAKGKYIALCEGDDYWTDQNKLQLQVDYMENNHSCSLCVHAGEKVSVNKKRMGNVRTNKGDKVYTTDDVILGGGGMFVTNSMLFPALLVKNLPEFYCNCPIGDYPLTIFLSLYGNVFYIDRFMSAYRVGVIGSWTNRIRADLNKRKIHISKIEKMLHDADSYSKYQHTDAINRYIGQINFKFLLEQEKYNEAKTGEYKSIYKNISMKKKIVINLKQYFPHIAKSLKKLKR